MKWCLHIYYAIRLNRHVEMISTNKHIKRFVWDYKRYHRKYKLYELLSVAPIYVINVVDSVTRTALKWFRNYFFCPDTVNIQERMKEKQSKLTLLNQNEMEVYCNNKNQTETESLQEDYCIVRGRREFRLHLYLPASW